MKVHELSKPANTWCTHCETAKGCAIYADRPQSCRVYECLWLRSQAFDKPLAPALRPDRSRVVIGTLNHGNDIVLYVPPEQPNAWQAPEFSATIAQFYTRGIPVHVSCNDVVTRIF